MSARGQAFILFTDLQGASNALRFLQDYPFFGKPIHIQYAKTKSKAFHIDAFLKKTKRHIESDPETEIEAEVGVEAGFLDKKAKLDELTPSSAIPNSILFIDELPADITEGVMSLIFQPCSGLKEIRLIPGQVKKAFVDFHSIEEATAALSILNGYRLSSSHTLHIEYARQ